MADPRSSGRFCPSEVRALVLLNTKVLSPLRAHGVGVNSWRMGHCNNLCTQKLSKPYNGGFIFKPTVDIGFDYIQFLVKIVKGGRYKIK